MPAPITPINESEFLDYIENGAARLTPRHVQQLVSDLPELREEFAKMRASTFPETERQLWFLAAIVEAVWTDTYRDMPYRAALEAAFAVSYFHRAVDLIPDALEVIGLTDDAAVVQSVIARNASAYEKFDEATQLDWAEFKLKPDAA